MHHGMVFDPEKQKQQDQGGHGRENQPHEETRLRQHRENHLRSPKRDRLQGRSEDCAGTDPEEMRLRSASRCQADERIRNSSCSSQKLQIKKLLFLNPFLL